MLKLAWVKSLNDKWLSLSELDFERIQTTGVYILWHGGEAPAVVRVGSGDIGTRLRDHYNNMLIRRYEKKGPLMVTWAGLESLSQRDGVENYLIELCRPLVSDYRPEADPVPVRSPFLG
ncbi:MAG: hypothetical protein ABJ275_00360 [Maricaulaceae bacterium]